MEHKEKAIKAGAWSTDLEDRVGNDDEKVDEKRGFSDTCDTGGGGTVSGTQGPYGERGGVEDERFENKRRKDDKRNQGGLEGQGKEEVVEKRKCPVSETVGTSRNQ
jgi:hypothetical protein